MSNSINASQSCLKTEHQTRCDAARQAQKVHGHSTAVDDLVIFVGYSIGCHCAPFCWLLACRIESCKNIPKAVKNHSLKFLNNPITSV